MNLLEPVKLIVWKVITVRVIIVKFRVNYGGGNGAGCFGQIQRSSRMFTDLSNTLNKNNELF